MRDYIRFWCKGFAALAIGSGLFMASQTSERGHEMMIGFKAMAIEAFGKPEQREALIEASQREGVERVGIKEFYEVATTYDAAIAAERRLVRLDARLADAALNVAIRERDARLRAAGEVTDFSPGEEIEDE